MIEVHSMLSTASVCYNIKGIYSNYSRCVGSIFSVGCGGSGGKIGVRIRWGYFHNVFPLF